MVLGFWFGFGLGLGGMKGGGLELELGEGARGWVDGFRGGD